MSIMFRLFGLASVALLSFSLSRNVQAQQANMTFFVTSVGPGKGGDLGGLAGADAHCQQLAASVAAGNKIWRAYLSTNAAGGSINARDRIGRGPWQNARGEVIARDIDDLHSNSNKLGPQASLTENGESINGMSRRPTMHDMLTGSQADGRAFPGNLNLTCNNWTSSNFGSAMVGHSDRAGGQDTDFQRSWNSAHMSRSCSQPDLIATGGNGLFYCFAVQ